MGWAVAPEHEGMVGFGSLERVLDTLERHFDSSDFDCGERFTMADVYVSSSVDWGLTFGALPPHHAFVAYAERLQARPFYTAAKAVDNALIEEMRQ
jgi:glutathione S-transferase